MTGQMVIAPSRISFPAQPGSTHLPALMGPLIAAVVVTAWTHGTYGVCDLGERMFGGATAATAGTIAAVVSVAVMIRAVVLVALEFRAWHEGSPSVLGLKPDSSTRGGAARSHPRWRR